MLESVTSPATEIPVEYADRVEVSPAEAFIAPKSWSDKSTKRKVFELCFIDKHTHQYASIAIGVTRPRVTQIVREILSLIDNL